MDGEKTSTSQGLARLPMMWKLMIVANAVVLLCLVVVSFQNYVALRMPKTRLYESSIVEAQGFNLNELRDDGRRGTFQMAKDSVQFAAWGDHAFVNLFVPADLPPLLRVAACPPRSKGAAFEVEFSNSDAIMLGVYDKEGRKRVALGVSETGEPYLEAYNTEGERMWSAPIMKVPVSGEN